MKRYIVYPYLLDQGEKLIQWSSSCGIIVTILMFKIKMKEKKMKSSCWCLRSRWRNVQARCTVAILQSSEGKMKAGRWMQKRTVAAFCNFWQYFVILRIIMYLVHKSSRLKAGWQMRKTPPQLCVFTCKDGWFSFWAWVDLGSLRMSPHMKSLWRGALP